MGWKDVFEQAGTCGEERKDEPKSAWRGRLSDNGNSKNLSSSDLSKSSNELVTEENNSLKDAIVNVVDNSQDSSESDGVAKRETCGFKMEKPKMPKFSKRSRLTERDGRQSHAVNYRAEDVC